MVIFSCFFQNMPKKELFPWLKDTKPSSEQPPKFSHYRLSIDLLDNKLQSQSLSVHFLYSNILIIFCYHSSTLWLSFEKNQHQFPVELRVAETFFAARQQCAQFKKKKVWIFDPWSSLLFLWIRGKQRLMSFFIFFYYHLNVSSNLLFIWADLFVFQSNSLYVFAYLATTANSGSETLVLSHYYYHLSSSSSSSSLSPCD